MREETEAVVDALKASQFTQDEKEDDDGRSLSFNLRRVKRIREIKERKKTEKRG